MQDDRVLKPTRVVSAIIIPVLSAAFVILYLFPTRTRQLWSWEMHPPMTAMVMGAGYLSGAYFFYRAVTARQWHRVGHGFVAITVFATMLGLATIVHWDRFNHDHVSFWAWALLYFSTPVLLPWLWVVNRRRDPRTPEPGDPLVPPAVRAVLVGVGAAQLVFAAVMYFRPTAIVGSTPWPLTELTARSLSAFAAVPSVIYLMFLVERRWSALQTLIEVVIIGMTLIGLAAVIAWDDFTGSPAVVWGWRIGLVIALSLLVAFRLAMGARASSAAAGHPVGSPSGGV